MCASAIDTLQAFLDEEAPIAPETDAQILVLEPIGPLSGLTSILLDRPKQLIGWDVECAIQLPDAGVHSRHAVIFRGQRHVVVKAWDPRTWLNGLPVTESPLADGDLLRIGPIEFRVRPATTDELLRDMPAAARIPDDNDHSELAGSLVLRRSRLSSIRIRLRELRAQLAREFERVHAEQVKLDVERAELEAARAELEARRAQFRAERKKAAAVAAAPVATAPGTGPEQRGTVAKQWNQDAARMNRLFRQPVRPSTDAVPATQPSVTASPPSVAEHAPVAEQKEADEHAEIADSVADYMEHLLGRARSRQGDGLAEDPPARRSSRGRVSSQNAASSPEEVQSPPAPRRPYNVEEIRAGVGTLREIANLSARAAVAKHSSRKLRQSSMAVTLPLAIISFVLAGVLFLIGGSEARFYSQAFGIVMLGCIALIELANAFWKAKNLDPARTPAVGEEEPDEPMSAGTDGASGASSASAT
jgi:pSer/pThr/pTyr-binding forkhead associated (FHA) protein